MLDSLLAFDKSAFISINNGLANPFLDMLCPLLRKQEFWYPMYAGIIYLLVRTYKVDTWKILLALGLMILASDQFSANLVKNTFMRLRPCAEPSLEGITRHLIASCNGYSFISAHATNHFAIAVFVSFFFKKHKWVLPVLLVWAAIISFSQVYVGVHYPLDVIVGGLCGILFGIAFSRYVSKFLVSKA
ncbi:MAG: phosphatase PAP2 family protein [Bacteroidetes bacterium B1(2017)]|nr:MAG: phosphatase PAP2 family protein [Bacteroidetes bacterium B1(2017)]